MGFGRRERSSAKTKGKDAVKGTKDLGGASIDRRCWTEGESGEVFDGAEGGLGWGKGCGKE